MGVRKRIGYKDLLRRYIDHVALNEGAVFLSDINYDHSAQHGVVFTDEEKKALESLAIEGTEETGKHKESPLLRSVAEGMP